MGLILNMKREVIEKGMWHKKPLIAYSTYTQLLAKIAKIIAKIISYTVILH